MKRTRIRALGVAAALVLGTGLSRALAGSRGGVEAEIESLSTALYHGNSGYVVEVKYEVEVDGGRNQPLDLVIYMIEDGYALTDASGERLAFVIPLERPTEYDDDELEFKARVTLDLPGDVAIDPWGLSAGAELFISGDPQPLDYKSDSVEYFAPNVDSSVTISTASYGVVLSGGFTRDYCPTVYYARHLPRVYSYGYCVPPRVHYGGGLGFHFGYHSGGHGYRHGGDHHGDWDGRGDWDGHKHHGNRDWDRDRSSHDDGRRFDNDRGRFDDRRGGDSNRGRFEQPRNRDDNRGRSEQPRDREDNRGRLQQPPDRDNNRGRIEQPGNRDDNRRRFEQPRNQGENRGLTDKRPLADNRGRVDNNRGRFDAPRSRDNDRPANIKQPDRRGGGGGILQRLRGQANQGRSGVALRSTGGQERRQQPQSRQETRRGKP